MSVIDYQEAQANLERPVFIEFEERAVEDRNASVREGHFVGRDVDFVIVTPPGGNLTVEKVAEDWLKEKEARRDPHALHYRNVYEAWKRGQEGPVDGTPIKDWPPLSPAQRKHLLSLNIVAVEDLATANEAVLGRIGMGGVALQKKALAWLESARDQGAVAEKVAALETENQTMKDLLAETLEANESLQKRLEALEENQPEKRKPGRPKKEAAA